MLKKLFPLMLVALLLCASCNKKQEAHEKTIAITDTAGNTVTVQDLDKTIIADGSLARIFTLAGGVPYGCTSDGFTLEGFTLPSGVHDCGSLKNPSLETMLSLSPHLVILTPNLSGQVKLGEQLKSAGIPVAWFEVESFDDYLLMLKTFTTALGTQNRYDQYGTAKKAEIEAIKAKAKKHSPPSVLLLRAYSSSFRAKGDDILSGVILKDLNTHNIVEDYPSLLEEISLEVIIKEDPDFIFVTTMGDVKAATDYLEAHFLSNPAVKEMRAVKNDRVIVLDKALFHLKPCERWNESYEKMYAYLY